MVKWFSLWVHQSTLTSPVSSLCSCQIWKIYIKLCFIIFTATPLLFFHLPKLSYSFTLARWDFKFFVLICKRKFTQHGRITFKRYLWNILLLLWRERNSYLFISPLCISWIKVLYVPSSLFSPSFQPGKHLTLILCFSGTTWRFLVAPWCHQLTQF